MTDSVNFSKNCQSRSTTEKDPVCVIDFSNQTSVKKISKKEGDFTCYVSQDGVLCRKDQKTEEIYFPLVRYFVKGRTASLIVYPTERSSQVGSFHFENSTKAIPFSLPVSLSSEEREKMKQILSAINTIGLTSGSAPTPITQIQILLLRAVREKKLSPLLQKIAFVLSEKLQSDSDKITFYIGLSDPAKMQSTAIINRLRQQLSAVLSSIRNFESEKYSLGTLSKLNSPEEKEIALHFIKGRIPFIKDFPLLSLMYGLLAKLSPQMDEKKNAVKMAIENLKLVSDPYKKGEVGNTLISWCKDFLSDEQKKEILKQLPLPSQRASAAIAFASEKDVFYWLNVAVQQAEKAQPQNRPRIALEIGQKLFLLFPNLQEKNLIPEINKLVRELENLAKKQSSLHSRQLRSLLWTLPLRAEILKFIQDNPNPALNFGSYNERYKAKLNNWKLSIGGGVSLLLSTACTVLPEVRKSFIEETNRYLTALFQDLEKIPRFKQSKDGVLTVKEGAKGEIIEALKKEHQNDIGEFDAMLTINKCVSDIVSDDKQTP